MLLPPNNRGRGLLRLGVALLSLGLPLISSAQMMNPTKPEAKTPAKIEGNAVWYHVPPKSLAKRRATKDELTAAHNRLPLGTRVRVTHLKNGKSVVVRITDRALSGAVPDDADLAPVDAMAARRVLAIRLTSRSRCASAASSASSS